MNVFDFFASDRNRFGKGFIMVNVCKHCQMQYISATKGYCCPSCKSLDEMRYAQIKAYLASYPNSNAIQIAEALDIKPYTILKYVDEGLLVVGRGDFEQI